MELDGVEWYSVWQICSPVRRSSFVSYSKRSPSREGLDRKVVEVAGRQQGSVSRFKSAIYGFINSSVEAGLRHLNGVGLSWMESKNQF